MRRQWRKLENYARVFGPLGAAFPIWTKLARRSFERTIGAANGHEPLTLRVGTSDVETYIKVFLDKEYEVTLRREPQVVVDAGANVGFASIFFANEYPRARVFAIEPEPSNFALLQKNVAWNPNIIPVHAALWRDQGPVDIVDPGIGHWGFQAGLVPEGNVAPSLGKVPGITIDGLMQEHGIPFIDVLKIDIEGAEKEVFETSAAWIERVGVLVVELHDRYKVGCARSFYVATRAFEQEYQRGENVFMLRSDFVPGPVQNRSRD